MAVPVAAGEQTTPWESIPAERAAHYYPAFLDLRERRVAVLGGGPVATQKVVELLPTGAEIVVIAPEADPVIGEWAATGALIWRRRSYRPGDLAGVALLLAADAPAVNAQATGEARRRGVLVNVADDPTHCDFIAPAVVRRGGLTVAISTGGRSPAFARYVRERLETALGEEYGAVLGIVAEVRQQMARRGQRVSGERWQAALREAVAAYQRGSGPAEARERLRRALGAFSHC